jgi:molecular chaperone DnaJ
LKNQAYEMSRKKPKTYYQILGIKSDVSLAEIKKAYRDLVKTYHPDLGSNTKEEMMMLNLAYETLKDKRKRLAYDITIGVSKSITIIAPEMSSLVEEEREKYLRQVFNPNRIAINKVLAMYKSQMRNLSLDPYDDQLISEFINYVDEIETNLKKSSDAFNKTKTPRSLEAAVHMMRYAIAQAADGLDELRSFCTNYDYNHLSMAESLFRISQDLNKQSVKLTKN